MKCRKYANQEKHELTQKKKDKAVGRVGGPWIVKPHDAAGGHGIFLTDKLADLGYVELVQLVSKWKKIVVSQYEKNNNMKRRNNEVNQLQVHFESASY